jgi:outer membrane autotransporter protein
MPHQELALWRMRGSPRRSGRMTVTSLAGLVASAGYAACLPTTTPDTNTSVVCDGVNSGSTNVTAQPGSTNVTIMLNAGATLSTNAIRALTVQDGSTIINNGQITVSGGSGGFRGAMAASGNNNTLINNGSIRTTSGGTAGISTALGGNSSGSQILNAGSITTTGGTSHGIYSIGPGNAITNSGTISAGGTGAKGVFMQGGNLVTNVLINTGTISATGANTTATSGFADAVHANTTGASTFYSRVENRAGGIITSTNSAALRGQNGNDTFVNAGYLEGHGGPAGDSAIIMGQQGTGTLILQTGSVIRGAADGNIGSKLSAAFLEGSGTVDNTFRNFQNLTMRGDAWSWLTDASFAQSIQVQTGTFTFNSTLAAPAINVLPGTTVAGTGTFAGNVNNQGTWLPGPGFANGFGALTVQGNYIGTGALLQINTVLGNDSSPADRLVIDGGNASGRTAIRVVNHGGLGALTLADGILVVQAVNGGTTAANAFSLTGPVEAGAFTYRLFRGGATGNNADSWYLRSSGYAVGGTIVGSMAEAVALIAAMQPPPVPGEPVPPPAAAIAIEKVHLYRPEVALFSAMPQVLRSAGLSQLGTFHERQGDQQLLADGQAAQASWGRVFGRSVNQRLRGDADPGFDGSVSGWQLGHDFHVGRGDSGTRDRIGLMGGYTRASGDVSGLSGGARDAAVGRLSIEGYSLGGYWTHIGASGWYTDTVLLAGRYKTDVRSTLGRGGRPDAKTLTASVEAGYPLALSDQIVLEPQTQLIWQRSTIDSFHDGLSAIQFGRDNAVTGRIGARLQGTFSGGGGTWKPYLKANLWHTFSGRSDVLFGFTDTIATRRNASALEVGVGISGQLNRAFAVYGGLAYTRAIGITSQNSTQGQLGMRYTW